MELAVLLPIAQALVLFHGYNLLVVRLPDDRIAVSLKALCRMLNLDRNGQMQRIQNDENLAGQLVLARIDTPRGPQYMDFLIVEAIPSWVMGLHLKRMAPEKRPLILALKVEAVEVFYGYFFKTDTEQVNQPVAPQTRRPALTGRRLQPPARTLREGSAEELVGIKAAIQRLEAGLDAVTATVHGMQAGLDGLTLEVRSLQHELRAKTARDEARLAALEGYRVQAQARIGRLERRLAQVEQVLAQLTAEPLTPLIQMVGTERIVAAMAERLLEIQERVTQLEPKPPRPRRGRPRRDRRR